MGAYVIGVRHYLLTCSKIKAPIFLVSSGCLTGSWSVWSHAVTPHSTIYHLVFVI